MRIVLAEDDPLTADAIAQSLRGSEHDVILARDGEETLRAVRAALPSALLLDMALPRMDGLAVLSALPMLRLERAPRVVALSPFRDEWIAKRATALGAACILPKPVELMRLHDAIGQGGWRGLDATAMDRIEHTLTRLGISLRTRGGLYLLEAVAITTGNFEAVEKMRDRVYAPIAVKNGTKPVNVERLIRHAIETACTRGNLKALHSMFGQTIRRETGKPTNAEFIAMVAEHMRLGRKTFL